MTVKLPLIESGSHTTGVSIADFALPPGTALRIERPAEALRSLLPSYTVLDSDVARGAATRSLLLPGRAMLWLRLGPVPIGVTIGNRRYAALAPAVVFGPTCRAMPVLANGGATVAVDIGPLAWARLFRVPAEQLRNRITPLDDLLPRGWTAELMARLAACDGGVDVKGVLDAFFLDRLTTPAVDEQTLAGVAALLADEAVDDLADAAARVGIGRRSLPGLTKRHLGFPPKTLLMQARFMRALSGMLFSDDALPGTVPAGYHDASHFIRDSNRFLGMTPRRFRTTAYPYLHAKLRARRLVLGAAMATLDRGVERVVNRTTVFCCEQSAGDCPASVCNSVGRRCARSARKGTVAVI